MSDPARASHPRPRGRSAGSLTPHMSVSMMCWGACLMRGGIAPQRTLQFPGKQWSEISLIVLRNRVEFLHRSLTRFASLRCSIFRKRLGASRLRSLTLTACAALTRPARSRVACNYRSDGRISNAIPCKATSNSLRVTTDYSLVA